MDMFTKEKKSMIKEQNAEGPVTHNVEEVLNHMLDAASIHAVFGQPLERGNSTVIPCAEVVAGMGMGSGSGQIDKEKNTIGSGSGGGGGTRARPIAAIVVSQDGVRVEPIVDVTRVALVAITTAAMLLFWLGRPRLFKRVGKGPFIKQFKKAVDEG
jgi:uncharacterized spore protein YtfJ